MEQREKLLELYNMLNAFFGDLHWWPADDAFEMMVGAILTQNTAWTNVEKAIRALREQRLLTPGALLRMSASDLAEVIKPSGYYRIKAARLKALVSFYVREYSGCIVAMRTEELSSLRKKLLTITGVGPETADSILLYACQKPIFVIDSYTRRIFIRHSLIDEHADYESMQEFVMNSLGKDVEVFNQFHALIVMAAKTFCRTKPKCDICPLASLDPFGINGNN